MISLQEEIFPSGENINWWLKQSSMANYLQQTRWNTQRTQMSHRYTSVKEFDCFRSAPFSSVQQIVIAKPHRPWLRSVGYTLVLTERLRLHQPSRMGFALNVCILKHETAKIKEKRRRHVCECILMELHTVRHRHRYQ